MSDYQREENADIICYLPKSVVYYIYKPIKVRKKENIMTEQEIEIRITKCKNDLAWWVAKLATSRTASNIGTRSVHVAWNERELARLKGIQFARHCDAQV